ncbi:DnaD domain protein [Peptoniphilus lacydonensis]|uniref:DnaD domain protein n=1 Tax=Peptoniphilus lacydonensis TaxID=1673725 RepID=UPI0008D92366|nr:DnaD domain protein [Peptoniphilus lacydonensis]
MSRRQGWITLYRELIKKPIWLNSTPEQKTILITLLLMANHEENEWEWKGQKFTVKPGQMITSLNSIVDKCGKGITTQNVRTALKRFEKLGFLTNESTKQNRLITIVNWRKYQSVESRPNKDSNNQLTNDQQRPNNQLTTNNNDNNENNDNNNYYVRNSEDKLYLKTFAECGGNCSKYNFYKLRDLEKEYGEEQLIKAIETSADNNKVTTAYIKGILNNWNKKEVVDGYEDLNIIKL